MKVLFVGQARPKYRGTKKPPSSLYGFSNAAFVGTKSMNRLKFWQQTLFEGIADVEVLYTNTCSAPGGTVPTEQDKKDLFRRTRGMDAIIAVGKVAADALRAMRIQKVRALPHPSGLNRALNDPKRVARDLRRCHEFLLKRYETLERVKMLVDRGATPEGTSPYPEGSENASELTTPEHPSRSSRS